MNAATRANNRINDSQTDVVRLRSVISPVLVAGLTLAACGSDSEAETTPPATEPTAAAAEPAAEEPPPEAAPAESAPATDAAADEPAEDSVDDGSAEVSEVLFPDVLDATATESEPGVWNFSATLSSPYDTPERYADAWRILAPDGTELGVRELGHDHANEQPFTRSLSGVEIPDGVESVTIEGRDQISGWGGDTVTVALTG